MIRFKPFLNESQWMYHGTIFPTGGKLRAHDLNAVDRAIGIHFAADVGIADKFAQMWKDYPKLSPAGPNQTGTVWRAKAPPRSRVIVIERGKGWDQNAVEAFVGGVVFAEYRSLFHIWMDRRFVHNIPREMADEIYDLLKQGKAPKDKKFDVAASHNSNSLKSYVHNFGGLWYGGLLDKIVPAFHAIMRKRGIEGLVYHNTSPMETEGIKSDKTYIIFEPEKLHTELVRAFPPGTK